MRLPDGLHWKRHFNTMVEGYERVANEPAWQSMRNMKTHPKDAVLPDGTIMSGNVFRRNILFYRDPLAKLFSFRNVNFDRYESDSNLIWHFGLPILTGQKKMGGASPDEWAAWQALGLDSHSLVADPLFVDPEHDNFRLKPESPALKLGFENIPVDRIGPYQDELRASWPIVEAEGVREKPLTSQGQKSP